MAKSVAVVPGVPIAPIFQVVRRREEVGQSGIRLYTLVPPGRDAAVPKLSARPDKSVSSVFARRRLKFGRYGCARPIHRLTEAGISNASAARNSKRVLRWRDLRHVGNTATAIAANSIRALGNKLANRPASFTRATSASKSKRPGSSRARTSPSSAALTVAENTDDTVVNPTLVGEVLSDSTEAYDRGRNSRTTARCRLVGVFAGQPKEPRIEQFSRQKMVVGFARAVGWRPRFSAFGVTLALNEIFAGVKFARRHSATAAANLSAVCATWRGLRAFQFRRAAAFMPSMGRSGSKLPKAVELMYAEAAGAALLRQNCQRRLGRLNLVGCVPRRPDFLPL